MADESTKVLLEELNSLEEIYKRSLKLIKAAANGINIEKEAQDLINDYFALSAKYKKGQTVWFFDNEYYTIASAEVVEIAFQSVDKTFNYRIYEKTGRYSGIWREDTIFGTKEELMNRLADILKQNK